ncbi:alpha-mannosidase [Paenibacillus gansuensis]|uniref:Alpha-mannosidase n=1 Tax=Paenibacillus gansuensis TaxID=306542 RepID=A0ABW5P9N2_9BACL
MFWTEEKLKARIRELSSYRYRNMIEIESFQFRLGQQEDVLRQGDQWGGRDVYAGLSARFSFPKDWRGKTIIGWFDFGKTAFGTTGGFESLLLVDGEPFQGVDTFHREVLFPSEFAGQEKQLEFQVWSGLEGMQREQIQMVHQFKAARIGWLDSAADDLYFTGRAALETLSALTDEAPEKPLIRQALNKAFQLIDWGHPGSDQFYASLSLALAHLNQGIERIGKHHPVTVLAIGHTHIDVAWLWRLKHTREKIARSFSTVLRLMEHYPEYQFLQTQSQLYDYIREDHPAIYKQIKDRAAEGRWEAGGAMWLEADCNLPSGESLVRQILYGTRFFRDQFGVECTYLWLPDVFGYSWALPQILKKSGIEMFMTTKISWNQYNRMPHDTFRWRGIDGTEILTHFITTPDVDNTAATSYTYNGVVAAQTVKGIWDQYRDKELTQDLLMCYGYGDGGGGVNRDMLEMRRRLDRMPGIPRVQTGRADVYFDKLRQTVENTEAYVHTWDGELYLELHRGTYTSQAAVKKANRKLELLFRESEILNILLGIHQENLDMYPKKRLQAGWTILLRNQFHDIIPGSSIQDVYKDSLQEYSEADAIARETIGAAAEVLQASEEPAYTVFNTVSWKRDGLALLQGADAEQSSARWTDSRGRLLVSQTDKQGVWIKMAEVPPMGYQTIYPAGKAVQVSKELPFRFTPTGISTPYYEMSWNECGQFTRIYDKQAAREVLKPEERGNVLQVYEDKPLDWDAWDIELYHREKMLEVTGSLEIKLVTEGPLFAIVRMSWQYQSSTIEQDIVFYSEDRRIDFRTKVHWHEQNQLLKVSFPVNIRATEATYDIQYGNVKRPTHWNTSWDMARFETAAHQWADLSERGYGVSILNDCKYGHAVKDHIMTLTLIKSAVWPDPQADQGLHEFTYSLYPHQGDWAQGSTVPAAWDLNQPLTVLPGKAADRPAEKSFVTISQPNVMLDALKMEEDGSSLIVRVHEYTGQSGPVEITADFSVQSWQECDLLERGSGEMRTGKSISFDIKPYEVKTFLLTIG